jgi:tetratricopeptide (TPR) repeat protein
MLGLLRHLFGAEKAGHSPESRVYHGEVLWSDGDIEAAELEFRQAVEEAPGLTSAHRSLGRLLFETGKDAEAERCFARVLTDEPGDRDVLVWAGILAIKAFKFKEAYGLLAQADAISPLDIRRRYLLGSALHYCGRLDEAEQVLMALGSAEPVVCKALAQVCLMKGNWVDGFRLFEQRLDCMRLYPEDPATKQWIDYIDTAVGDIPKWAGEPLAGKRLLLWMEQGFGDVLMMLRLVPSLLEKWDGIRVSLLALPPLQGVIESINGLHYISALPNWRASREDFDAHCPLMSLPNLLAVTCDDIPGRMPYVVPDDKLRRTWDERVSATTGLRVGVAWSGNSALLFDALRSLTLYQLAPVLAVPGASFFSLQKDEASRRELEASGMPVHDFMNKSQDFMDTAALIGNLDLVITVDTAVAHLAGAVGKPVWLLNRFESEWRWLYGREDSVWYPSMRIFNQTSPRDWGKVIERVAKALKSVVVERRT